MELRPCRAIGLKQHSRLGPGEVDTAVPGVAGSEVGVRRKVLERGRPVDEFRETIVFAVLVAVGREDVLHVKAQRVGLAARLLHTLERIVALLLGFEHCDRHSLGHVTCLHT